MFTFTFSSQLFGKIDENDIQQLARNENYDCAILFKRLFYDDAMKNVEKNVQHTIPIPYKAFTNDMQPVNQTAIKREVNTMWTSDEGQAVFTTSLVEIHKKITSPKTNDHSEWMQNDEAAVDFIIASAKLRAINFHIPQKSYLETKRAYLFWQYLNLNFSLNNDEKKKIISVVLCLKAPKKPDLPNESLEGIFTNCDDKTLLCASRVCKQFRSVVEGVFERRYSNKPYEIYTDGLTDEDAPSLPFRQFHRAILINFGSKFCWIITQINNISWFADILKKNGTNLKILTVIPSIAIHPLLQEPHDLGQVFSQLPSLTELNLCRAMLQSNWPKYDMPNLKHYNVHATFYENEKEFYAKFFTHNTQIETISAREVGDENMLRAMSGHLNHLKTLHIQDYFPPQDELDVSLHSLETLSLSNDEIQLKIRDALRPFQRGCKNIKRLKIVECATMEDNDVSAIVSFEKITSLKIEVEDIKITHLRLIEYQLPNLSFFSLTTQLNDENNDNRASDIDKILSMISKCKCLTKLHVKTQKDYFEQMNATFHSRFLKAIGAKRQQFVLTLTYVPVPTSLMTVTKEKITWSGDDDLSPPVVVYQAE